MSETSKERRPLHCRLRNLGLLQREDEQLLEGMLESRMERDAGAFVVNEGERHQHTRVLLRGWAIRYRTLPDGERQIINILLPGDMIGLYGMLFPNAEATVELITDASLADIPAHRVLEVFDLSSRLAAALCWIAAQDERMLEQQIVRIGRLNARKRVAHLLLELLFRQVMAGATPVAASEMPLTQSLIAEALALSSVHTNRCVRALCEQEWIETRTGLIVVHDPEKLAAFCGFDHASFSTCVIDEVLRERLNSRAG